MSRTILSANISREITEEAEYRNLGPICTGGGCDYIFREVDGEKGGFATLILASTEDLGSSPDTLDEPATVAIYGEKDVEWLEGVYLDFPNVEEAVDFMQKPLRIWFNQ
ncbi:MAG: hypothetical protein P8M70_04435 [Verrucomicrobiota bacterium]|nr:hypothetical protein [Verrucomicrobiota bacterium]